MNSLWIAPSDANAAAFSWYLDTFSIKGNPVFSNGLKGLTNYPPDCPILFNWVFNNFILAEEFFAKALRSLDTCVLANNNLSGKLFWSLESPIILDESWKVTSVSFFIPCFKTLIVN